MPYGNRNCWDCPHCEQYNGFQEVRPNPPRPPSRASSEDQRTGSGSQGDMGGFMFRPPHDHRRDDLFAVPERVQLGFPVKFLWKKSFRVACKERES